MRKRNLNADLIRCVAVFSVLSVHFLLRTGFYGVPVEGTGMLIMCMYRSLFMVCVPLFMILTGYLMWEKTLSRRYYKGIAKTLEIYVMASIVCLLFKKYMLEETVTLKSSVLGILDFDAANYAWYVEMYIGLFLIIPFLNLAYHGLKTQKEKRILLLTMLFLTMLPKLVNNFDLTTPDWWLSPPVSKEYDPLVPGFFTAMYPITYYFIGAYLREYDWKISRKKNALLLILAVAVFGTYNYYRSHGVDFIWGSNSTWGGENLITAVLLFTLLLHFHPDRWPKPVQKILIYISGISFGVYLLSWVSDQIVYNGYLNPLVTEVKMRWKYYPAAVPASFLLSVCGASVLYFLRRICGGIYRKLRDNLTKRQE
ncbi:MAG: acyltransferase family protein [Lachnospiraceae bacterium]|nr:acyltransferase family protein [Lachnospiraceae bacterium]